MPTFRPEQLESLATRILEAAGVRPSDAAIVARELKDANLVGHDSHGRVARVESSSPQLSACTAPIRDPLEKAPPNRSRG